MEKTAIKQKIRQGYKETTIGLIPKEWEVRHLGECCKGKPQYGANASSVDYDPSLPRYIRITDITEDGDLIQTDKRSIPIEKVYRAILNRGDFLFARTGATVGKTYLHHSYKGVCAFAGYLIRFVPNPEILLPEYLKYYTETSKYWDWVKNTTRAGAQPNINSQEYSSLKIPCPPIHEQESIVKILSLWQDSISRIKKLISAKRRLKKALMQQLLTGKRRFKEFKGEKWKRVKLGEYVKLQGGYAFKSSLFRDEGIPIIRISNIQDYKIELEGDVVYYADIGIGEAYKVKKGDILVAMSGATTGKIGRYMSEDICYLNQRVGKFHAEYPNKFSYDFLAQIVHFRDFKKGIALDLATGAQPNISSSQIENISIFIPLNLKEQKKISAVLAQCDKEIEQLNHQLKLLKQQKRGLMQKLLTGKIRVKV